MKQFVKCTDVRIGESEVKKGINKGTMLKFAILTFFGLGGKATRIIQSPELALAYKGRELDGQVIQVDVEPYKLNVKQEDGSMKEEWQTKRRVVVLEGESIKDATRLSGHTLVNSENHATLQPAEAVVANAEVGAER